VEIAHDVGHAIESRDRLVQPFSGELERAAVVGLQHEQPHDRRRIRLEHVLEQHEVAERLGHLLGVHLQQPAVHPVADERPTRRGFRLGELVLVVREDEVGRTAVYVERYTEFGL
jgi:hypothetical protein